MLFSQQKLQSAEASCSGDILKHPTQKKQKTIIKAEVNIPVMFSLYKTRNIELGSSKYDHMTVFDTVITKDM